MRWFTRRPGRDEALDAGLTDQLELVAGAVRSAVAHRSREVAEALCGARLDGARLTDHGALELRVAGGGSHLVCPRDLAAAEQVVAMAALEPCSVVAAESDGWVHLMVRSASWGYALAALPAGGPGV